MDKSSPVSNPIASRTKLSLEEDELPNDPTLFKQIMGSLQYLTLTHPNIAYVVGQASQFLQKPTSKHLKAA